MKPKCPGQDRRFWKSEDIFTAPCPVCGTPVEFFKDDRSRKCRVCGRRSKDPRLDISCIAWCPYTHECVDYLHGEA